MRSWLVKDNLKNDYYLCKIEEALDEVEVLDKYGCSLITDNKKHYLGNMDDFTVRSWLESILEYENPTTIAIKDLYQEAIDIGFNIMPVYYRLMVSTKSKQSIVLTPNYIKDPEKEFYGIIFTDRNTDKHQFEKIIREINEQYEGNFGYDVNIYPIDYCTHCKRYESKDDGDIYKLETNIHIAEELGENEYEVVKSIIESYSGRFEIIREVEDEK